MDFRCCFFVDDIGMFLDVFLLCLILLCRQTTPFISHNKKKKEKKKTSSFSSGKEDVKVFLFQHFSEAAGPPSLHQHRKKTKN